MPCKCQLLLAEAGQSVHLTSSLFLGYSRVRMCALTFSLWIPVYKFYLHRWANVIAQKKGSENNTSVGEQVFFHWTSKKLHNLLSSSEIHNWKYSYLTTLKRTNAYCWLPVFSDREVNHFLETMACLLFIETWRYFIIEFKQIYQMFHPTVFFWQVYEIECWVRLINQMEYERLRERIQYIWLKP